MVNCYTKTKYPSIWVLLTKLLKYASNLKKKGNDESLNYNAAFNDLTPRVKPLVIQTFISFDSMDRTLKCDHSLKRC